MANQQPFKMKWITAAHNLFLCFGSLGMLIAGLYGVVEVYKVKIDNT
jgi:hypothetical protein